MVRKGTVGNPTLDLPCCTQEAYVASHKWHTHLALANKHCSRFYNHVHDHIDDCNCDAHTVIITVIMHRYTCSASVCRANLGGACAKER